MNMRNRVCRVAADSFVRYGGTFFGGIISGQNSFLFEKNEALWQIESAEHVMLLACLMYIARPENDRRLWRQCLHAVSTFVTFELGRRVGYYTSATSTQLRQIGQPSLGR